MRTRTFIPGRGLAGRVHASTWLCLLLGAAHWQCTNSDLLLGEKENYDKLTVSGEVCTTDPADAMFNTRILFLVDCSDSMGFNDPKGERGTAIKDVIKNYRDQESVLFGVARFGTKVVIETETYTKDEQELDQALAPIVTPGDPNAYLGGTDYYQVLVSASDFVEKDRVLHASDMEATYVVVFITDGAPQSDDFDPAVTIKKILDQVDFMHIKGTILHTFLLTNDQQGIPAQFLTLLTDMARKGTGQYRELAAPAALADTLGELLEVSVIRRIFDLKNFMVLNRNTVIAEAEGGKQILPDSDGDGLSDQEEEQMGTSPVRADSDRDNISDLVEKMMGYDPLAQEQLSGVPPTEFEDDDKDGLNNYEEKLLSTRRDRFDSDADGVPDGVEVRLGTDPLRDDRKGDLDKDGRPNLDELREHTNPKLDEGGQALEFAYQYSTLRTGRRAGTYCYNVKVDNIRLRTTLAGEGREEGTNDIELLLIDSPEDASQLMGNQRLGKLEVVYRAPSYRDPSAVELKITSEDLK